MEWIVAVAIAVIGGIFALAFKQRRAFDRFSDAFLVLAYPVFIGGIGFVVGVVAAGHDPPQASSVATNVAYIVIAIAVVRVAVSIAGWLAQPTDGSS